MHPADTARATGLTSKQSNQSRTNFNCQGSETKTAGFRTETSFYLAATNKGQKTPPVLGRICLLADTANLFRSAQQCFGKAFVPDYGKLLRFANSRGNPVNVVALVNDGMPENRVRHLRSEGYRVLFSEGRDCDFRFVDEAVALHDRGDTFLLCGGDHRYVELTRVLQRLEKRVIVSAVRMCCSRDLMNVADEFLPLPVMRES